jgi:hypothetical protein
VIKSATKHYTMPGAIKNIVISAHLPELQDKFLSYDISREIKYGLWQIAIRDLIVTNFESEDLNDIIQISSNFVTDVQVKDGKRIGFFPVLSSFVLDNKSRETKLFRADQTWFECNRTEEVLEIFFFNAESQKIYKKDCKIFLSILLQKIK